MSVVREGGLDKVRGREEGRPLPRTRKLRLSTGGGGGNISHYLYYTITTLRRLAVINSLDV